MSKMRSITMKHIDSASTVVQIDDSLTAQVLVFHTAKAMIENKADKVLEYHKANARNLANVMKQVRAYQRSNSIYFSSDNSKTEYVLDTRKRKTIKTKKVEKVNRLSIYHCYNDEVLKAYQKHVLKDKAQSKAKNVSKKNTVSEDRALDKAQAQAKAKAKAKAQSEAQAKAKAQSKALDIAASVSRADIAKK